MSKIAKGASLAQCIKAWEQKNVGKKISEEEEVSFICNIPLIVKLDNSINTLEKCKKLSLSTNRIEKLIPMAGLKNIEILSLSRNCLKKIQFLEEISGTLKQLWLSYNSIEKLDNIQCLKKLQVLYLFHNKIKAIEEIDKLSALPELVEIGLKGNPIYEGKTNDYMKLFILKKLPQLKIVDNETVTEKQRNGALTLET